MHEGGYYDRLNANKRMKQEEYIKKLVEFKPSMKTAEVVKYLDSKKYHADDLRSPENKKRLGAKRKGKRNLIYDTFKVLQLKIELLKSA